MIEWSKIISCILKNKEWLFDGAGVVFVVSICTWFFQRKKPFSHQPAGSTISTVNQSGGNNHIGDKYFQSSLDRDDKTPPSIILGRGLEYDVPSVGKNGIYRTLYICIKNNRKNNYLSSCRLGVIYGNANTGLKKIMLSDVFTLQQDEERYIQLASCHEAVDKIINPNGHLLGNINFSTACWRSAFGRPELPRNQQHIILLQLEYEGMEKIGKRCRLWINEAGRLSLEEYTKL